MAIPIVELIAADRVSALSSVSVEGAYGVTLLVKEPDYVADSPGDGVCILKEGDWEYEDQPPCGKDGIYQMFHVVVYVRGGNDTNYQRYARQYANDVKKALMLDESCGGRARWSRVKGVRQFNDGALRGVIVDYQVYFWTAKDLPDQP